LREALKVDGPQTIGIKPADLTSFLGRRYLLDPKAIVIVCFHHPFNLRAPRIIGTLQIFGGHKNAAKEAAAQENIISTIDELP